MLKFRTLISNIISKRSKVTRVTYLLMELSSNSNQDKPLFRILAEIDSIFRRIVVTAADIAQIDEDTPISIRKETISEKHVEKATDKTFTRTASEVKLSTEGIKTEPTNVETISTEVEKTTIKTKESYDEEIAIEWIENLKSQLMNHFSEAKHKIKQFFYLTEDLEEKAIHKKVSLTLGNLPDFGIEEMKTLFVPFLAIEANLECVFKLRFDILAKKVLLPITLSKPVANITNVNFADTLLLSPEERELIEKVMQKLRGKFGAILSNLNNLNSKLASKALILSPADIIEHLKQNILLRMLDANTFEVEIEDRITQILIDIENGEQFELNQQSYEEIRGIISDYIPLKQQEIQTEINKIYNEFLLLKRDRERLEQMLKRSEDEQQISKRELMKRVQEFEEKKTYLLKKIKNLKLLREKTEKWYQILADGSMDDLSNLLLTEFKSDLVNSISKIEPLSSEETIAYLKEKGLVEVYLKEIKLFFINIPLSIIDYRFSKENSQQKEKVVLFHPTNDLIFQANIK